MLSTMPDVCHIVGSTVTSCCENEFNTSPPDTQRRCTSPAKSEWWYPHIVYQLLRRWFVTGTGNFSACQQTYGNYQVICCAVFNC